MFPGWHRRLAQFLDDADINTHIVSNFARVFSDDDLDALAKFDAIQISFDSADTQMVRKLRSKADLRTIAFNIVRLRQRAREMARTQSLVVNCTLWRDNIGGIAKLAGFCRELGIDQLLLTEGFISTAHNSTVPDTLDTLRNDDILLFAQQILAAEALLSDCGTSLRLQDHLRSRIGELLEEVRNGESAKRHRLVPPTSAYLGMPSAVAIAAGNAGRQSCAVLRGRRYGSNRGPEHGGDYGGDSRFGCRARRSRLRFWKAGRRCRATTARLPVDLPLAQLHSGYPGMAGCYCCGGR